MFLEIYPNITIKEKEIGTTSRQGDLYSHIFKPRTTTFRQVMMRGIACTIERVERYVSRNTVDRAGVRHIKTTETPQYLWVLVNGWFRNAWYSLHCIWTGYEVGLAAA